MKLRKIQFLDLQKSHNFWNYILLFPLGQPPPPPVSGGDNFYQNQGVPGNFQPPITRPPLTNGSQNPKYPAYPSNNNTGQQQPPPPPVSGGYPQQPPVSGGDNFYQNQGSSSVQNLASRLGNFSLNQVRGQINFLTGLLNVLLQNLFVFHLKSLKIIIFL